MEAESAAGASTCGIWNPFCEAPQHLMHQRREARVQWWLRLRECKTRLFTIIAITIGVRSWRVHGEGKGSNSGCTFLRCPQKCSRSWKRWQARSLLRGSKRYGSQHGWGCSLMKGCESQDRDDPSSTSEHEWSWLWDQGRRLGLHNQCASYKTAMSLREGCVGKGLGAWKASLATEERLVIPGKMDKCPHIFGKL